VFSLSLSVLCVISVRSGSHVSSSVSLKSDWSKEGLPPFFSEKTPSSNKRYFVCLHYIIGLYYLSTVIELDCVRGFMKLTPVTQLHRQTQGGINSLWKIDHATKYVHPFNHSYK